MNNNKALELFARADALYRQGQYRESLAALNGMAAAFPDNKALLYAMALCLERLERQEEAIRLCDRLIREFHFDKALILKARLVTTPTDAEKAAANEDRRNAWPQSFDVQGQSQMQVVVDAQKATPTRWYGIAAIGISGALIFFLLTVKYIAQADTVVPGALPTLFPMRLLFLFILTLIAEVTVIFYCNAKLQRQHTGMLLTSLICGVLFLLPFPGWLLTTWILRKRFHVGSAPIMLITVVSLGCCLLTAWLGAYMLDLTDPLRIFMELKAGYG